MRSMTGYGEGSAANERFEAAVTIRTVNHRFLDLSIRMSEEFRAIESALTAAVKSSVQRGRVELRLAVKALEPPRVEVGINEDAARAYLEAASKLAASTGADDNLSVSQLFRLPDVVRADHDPVPIETEDAQVILGAARLALDVLVAAREREGAELASALQDIVGSLKESAESLATKANFLQEEATVRLKERITELSGVTSLDETRLAQEAGILLEKSDIREEIDRLRAHVEQAGELLSTEGQVGKRLDILAQEILRELNTIGSKSRNTEATRMVMDGKLFCEQLREQVQNLE